MLGQCGRFVAVGRGKGWLRDQELRSANDGCGPLEREDRRIVDLPQGLPSCLPWTSGLVSSPSVPARISLALITQRKHRRRVAGMRKNPPRPGHHY